MSSTIGEPQPTPSTLRWMNADGWRVVMARAIRSFGFSTIQVGLVLTAALVGDIIPDILHRRMGMETAFAIRAMFAGYALIALAMGTLFLSMSDKIETPSSAPHTLQSAMITSGKPLQKSRGIVLRLAALFALDAFAGG